ncbi:nuclear transport factor 2 family protein [Sporosarcina sp. A2]|uniref:nuclear transport factor 2 family protein n=1 Tax=Sporosarcina sp. A2 TaxID=3393449 RepID=UPI003D7ABD0D
MKTLSALVGTAALALVLTACSGNEDGKTTQGSVDDGEKSNEYGSIDHGVKDKDGVGFSLNGETIEEAANVPEDEKKAILTTFNRYIDTLNSQQIDEYLNTLSTATYNLDEERAATEELLATGVLTRTPDDATIVKYSKEEAQVFTTMETSIKVNETGAEEASKGRQVTVLTKEDGDWKVKAVHYIGDPQ